MTIIKRADLGRPLTWDELDDNFQQVDDLTAAASAAVSSASASATAAAGSATNSLNSANSASGSAADAAASATSAINALMNSTFEPSDFDFTSGGTLDSTDRNKAVYNPADNNWYSWSGTLPKIVSAGEDPTTDSNWKPRTDQLLRQELASTTGPDMIGLSGGLSTLRDAVNCVYPEAFGTTNDDVRLQAAINSAVATGKRLICTNRNFTINAQITIPTRLNADFTGTVITAGPAITSGAAVKVDGVASVAAGQYAGTIHNFTLIRALVSGHADTSSNVDGISFNGASGQASDMKWYNPQVYGFRDVLRFDGPNTYLNHFILPRIGFGWRRGVAVYASVNSNENHGFIGGSIFNINNTSFDGVGVYVDPGASATEIYMSNTSIDYCDISAYLSLGRLNLNSCHLENNNNNPHIVLNYTSGKEKPTVVAVGGLISGGPNVTTWTGIPVEDDGGRPALIYAYNAGSVFVHLYGVKTGDFEANVTRNTQILKVQGNNADVIASFKCEPLIDAGNTASASRPLRICNAINEIVVNAYNLNSWTQSYTNEGIVFSVDTGVYYDADAPHSRKCVGTGGLTSSIYQEINCKGGDIINVNAFVNVTSLTAGTVNLRCDYLDFKGNVINTDIKTISAVTSGWQQVWVFKKIPNGAVKVRVQEYYSSFTGTAYFSNENMWSH